MSEMRCNIHRIWPVVSLYRGLWTLLTIKLWFGQINIKRKANSLFSERNGYTPSLVVGPFRLTWRSFRKEKSDDI